jgi:F-type H+-transporting ATPase subunit delta
MSFDDQQMAVASVYAKAMLDLAEERSVAESLLEELRDFAAYLEKDAAAADFFASPLVDARARAAALERAFRGKASDLLSDSLQVIQSKGRLGLVPAIARAYGEEYDRRRGVVDAKITTAIALSPELRERLRAELAAALGKTMRLQEVVDPELLGGLVIETSGRKLDSSVTSQLARLSNGLLERATNEIVRTRDAGR